MSSSSAGGNPAAAHRFPPASSACRNPAASHRFPPASSHTAPAHLLLDRFPPEQIDHKNQAAHHSRQPPDGAVLRCMPGKSTILGSEHADQIASPWLLRHLLATVSACADWLGWSPVWQSSPLLRPEWLAKSAQGWAAATVHWNAEAQLHTVHRPLGMRGTPGVAGGGRACT